jgi:hypothetical protein
MILTPPPSNWKIEYDIGSQGEFLYNVMEFNPGSRHKLSGWRMIQSYKTEEEANKALENLRKNEVAL